MNDCVSVSFSMSVRAHVSLSDARVGVCKHVHWKVLKRDVVNPKTGSDEAVGAVPCESAEGHRYTAQRMSRDPRIKER
jgi:hypothetical protein